MTATKLYLTLSELDEATGIPQSTLYKWVQIGRLKADDTTQHTNRAMIFLFRIDRVKQIQAMRGGRPKGSTASATVPSEVSQWLRDTDRSLGLRVPGVGA